jgi:chaperone required for assembly of F1-ATPase
VKRFWDEARVVEEGGRYAIRLDGRPMRLPGGPLLALERRALAEAIAAEWQAAGGARGGALSAEDLPLTRIAGTAQDRVEPDPAPTIAALLRYAEADLLCYRAEAPAELAQRQQDSWQPWLDWAAERFGASLEPTRGVRHIPQSPAALGALRTALEAHSPAVLAGLGILVPALGSLVLGLAVAHGALPAETAHRLALLDELHQAEKWGEDREAIARRRAILHDIETAARFLQLSTPATSG